MARSLGPDALGALLLGISVVSFAGGAASLGLRMAAGRRIASAVAGGRSSDALRTARTAVGIAVLAGCVGGALVALAPALGLIGKVPVSLLPVLSPVILGLAVGNAVWGISQGRHDTRGRAVWRDAGGGLLRLAGVAVAAGVSGGLLSFALGWALGSLVGEALFVAYALRRGWLRRGAGGADRELVASLPPFGGLALVEQIRTWLDMLLLGLVAPLAVVGTYGLAQSVGRVLGMIEDAAAHLFLPLAASAVERGEEAELAAIYGKARSLTFSFLWLPLAPCLFRASDVVLLAFGPAHADAATPLRVLAASLLVPALLGYTDELLVARDRPGTVLSLGLAGTALTAALLLVLVPRWGVAGAAVASGAGLAVRSFAGWARLGEAPRRATLELRALAEIAATAAPAVAAAALLVRAGSVPPLVRVVVVVLAASPAAVVHLVRGIRSLPEAGGR